MSEFIFMAVTMPLIAAIEICLVYTIGEKSATVRYLVM